MKMNLFGPAAWRWQPDNYLPPFDSMADAPADGKSEYDRGSGKVSTSRQLSGLVLEALTMMSLWDVIESKGTPITGCGCTKEMKKFYFRLPVINQAELLKAANDEVIPEHDTLEILYERSTGKISASYIDAIGRNKVSFNDYRRYFFAAIMMSAIATDPCDEATENYQAFLNLLISGSRTAEQDKLLSKAATVLSNNLYSRTCIGMGGKLDEEEEKKAVRVDISNIEHLEPETVDSLHLQEKIGNLCSSEEDEDTEEDTTSSKVGNKELKGWFSITDRPLTRDEEMLVPEIPDSYQITEQHIQIAKMIRDSGKLPTPKRNFLFVGEAGSGKSESAKIQAFLANKPLLHQSMDPDTDKFDTCQQVIPDGNGGFAYVEGPLIEAIEKGWWVEVSEADLVVKQGALGYLNPLFDKTATLQLNTGRVVKRHPESVVFFTINATYEGCRPMNRAVKDRMKIVHFEMPDDAVLVDRVMKESGLDDRKTVQKMVDVIHRVSEYCSINSLEDGVAGVRSLVDWAGDVALGIDPWESARDSIVWRWTFEESEHDALMKCVETQFMPKEVEL